MDGPAHGRGGWLAGSTAWSVRFDQGGTYTNEDIAVQTKEKIAGYFLIKMAAISNTSEYKITYKVRDSQYLDEEKMILLRNKKIVFSKNLRDSFGFVRPVLIMRSKKNTCDSTDVIKEYKLVVSERESVETVNVEYELFKEKFSRGSSNVVQ